MTTHKDALSAAQDALAQDIEKALHAVVKGVLDVGPLIDITKTARSIAEKHAQPEQQPVAQSEMEKFDSYMMAAFGKGNRQLRAEAYTWDDMASCWYASDLQNAIDAALSQSAKEVEDE